MALCRTLSDGGLRRSEAAALEWRDLAIKPDGTRRLTVRRSKTDALGRGEVVALTPAAVRALLAVRRGRRTKFPLHPGSIGRRVKAATRAAGLRAGFSGHSGRVGLARSMTARGTPTDDIQQAGLVARSREGEPLHAGESASATLVYLMPEEG